MMKAHRDDRERIQRLTAYRYALSGLLRFSALSDGDRELVKRHIITVATAWGKSVRSETRREDKAER